MGKQHHPADTKRIIAAELSFESLKACYKILLKTKDKLFIKQFLIVQLYKLDYIQEIILIQKTTI